MLLGMKVGIVTAGIAFLGLPRGVHSIQLDVVRVWAPFHTTVVK